MDLSTFIQKRRAEWVKFEQMLDFAQGSGLRGFSDEDAIEFGRLYRSVASDLNQAQTFVSGDEVVSYLNQLVARGYGVAYGSNRRRDWWGLVRAMWVGYPRIVRANLGPLLLATAIFFAGALVGFLFSSWDSAFMECCVPAGFTHIEPRQFEDDEDPTEDVRASEISAFAGFLFANNTKVSILVFALGFTFGIGTTWVTFSNGLMMGAITVLFWNAEAMVQLCAELLPHGVLEIPAILIGAAGGLRLAQGMIRARTWTRLDELARVGNEAVMLVAGVVPLMAVAGLLEAGLSRLPNWLLGDWLKLTVAAIIGTLFVAYIALVGHRRTQPPPAVEQQ